MEIKLFSPGERNFLAGVVKVFFLSSLMLQ